MRRDKFTLICNMCGSNKVVIDDDYCYGLYGNIEDGDTFHKCEDCGNNDCHESTFEEITLVSVMRELENSLGMPQPLSGYEDYSIENFKRLIHLVGNQNN